MDTWLVNGRVAGSIPVTDRGLAYADGLFETIAFRAGGPRFLDFHLQRLRDGCARLGITCPPELELQADMQAAAGNRLHGTVKLMVTRGSGPRGYAPPPAPQPTRIVAFFPAGQPVPRGAAAGVSVRLCQTPLSLNPALAGMKTLGRLDHVLARAEWQDPLIAEGLMRDPAGRVVCGTMSNVFAVQNGRLLTPGLEQCGVRGVMRRVVIHAARQLGIIVEEGDLTADGMLTADELFLTNALIGIWPVARCDDHQYGIGPVTRALRHALVAAGVEECRS